MKSKKSSKGLVIAIGLAAVLLGITAYAAFPEVTATGNMAYSDLSGGPATVTLRKLITDPRQMSGSSPMVALPAEAGDIVTEWNQHAIMLTLLPASALAPVQQTRVMAIVQVSVHDAVNGITGEYATYLSAGPAPENASPEAAAIAAAHHALRNLFGGHEAAHSTLLYLASLDAHELSEGDPGIEYGRSAAAAILALRANDHSAEAQYNYTAPGAGTPGVWVPLTSAPALLPGWGDVTPWVLHNVSQFQPPPPPALKAGAMREITTRSKRSEHLTALRAQLSRRRSRPSGSARRLPSGTSP